MLKHTFIFCALVFSLQAFGQTPCTPNDTVTTVVYPGPEVNGIGGIPITACKGQLFDFTWTINIPPTITLGGFTANLDSVVVAQTNGVKNLPANLTYTCNPPNCRFKANTKGCINITGITSNTVPAGDIDLLIATTIHANVFGGAITQNFDLPNENVTGPGKYVLRVRESSDPACMVSTQVFDALISDIRMSPVPALTQMQVEVDVLSPGDYQLLVLDLNGRQIAAQTAALVAGTNTTAIDVSAWASGNYQLLIVKDGNFTARKFQVTQR